MSGTESEKLPSEESTGQQSPADELLQHMTDSVKSEAELKPVAGDTEISPVATDVESSIISASELVMDTRSSLSPVEEEVAKEVSEKKGKEATMANEENEVESSDAGSGEKSVTTGSQDQDWEDILGNGQLMKKVRVESNVHSYLDLWSAGSTKGGGALNTTYPPIQGQSQDLWVFRIWQGGR